MVNFQIFQSRLQFDPVTYVTKKTDQVKQYELAYHKIIALISNQRGKKQQNADFHSPFFTFLDLITI